ncbi:hypothetical protein MKW98_009320, partial [Papaver atlanticum]
EFNNNKNKEKTLCSGGFAARVWISTRFLNSICMTTAWLDYEEIVAEDCRQEYLAVELGKMIMVLLFRRLNGECL